MITNSVRINVARVSALVLLLAAVAVADQRGVRAALVPAVDRKPAAGFALKDASGKTARLKDYRGYIVLLDFWATWCTGCKQEIPWFSALQESYGAKRFAVVGISLDDGGWKVVKPFVANATIPYRMLLGDGLTARRYKIGNMPDTFLIDRHGKVAAAYTAGIVDKDDVAANIKMLLAEH
jgi:peroxiredoxin